MARLAYLELIFLADFNSNERKIFQRLCECVIYPDNLNTEALSKLISQLLLVEVSIRCTRDYKEIRIINDQGWYCHLSIGRYNNF